MVAGFSLSRVIGTNSARTFQDCSRKVVLVPNCFRKEDLFLGLRSQFTLSGRSSSRMISVSRARRMLRQVMSPGLGSSSSEGSRARLAFVTISFSVSSMTLGESHFITTSLSFALLLARISAWSFGTYGNGSRECTRARLQSCLVRFAHSGVRAKRSRRWIFGPLIYICCATPHSQG